MAKELHNIPKRKPIMLIIVLLLLLLASIAVIVYLTCWKYDSYLQKTDEIYTMEAGILRRNLDFAEGEDVDFSYDFTHSDYAVLISQYGIDEIAGSGSEFERAANLMNEFASRLRHQSNHDNNVEIAALPLLNYSLDSRENGINCRCKAQILNEMCLALNIYARKVWIMPYSEYDRDCHVVNEVWDTELNKWVMLDITLNEYWVDENGTPLSVLEIRQKGALQEFCTPVKFGEKAEDLEQLKQKHIGDFLYIMKNMVYVEYCTSYTVGESDTFYLLLPVNMSITGGAFEKIISPDSCGKSPMN